VLGSILGEGLISLLDECGGRLTDRDLAGLCVVDSGSSATQEGDGE